MLRLPSKVLRATSPVFLLLLLLLLLLVLDDVISYPDNSNLTNQEGFVQSEQQQQLFDDIYRIPGKNLTQELSSALSESAATNSKTRRSAYAAAPSAITGTKVDKIEDVELGPTHFVITTTKEGPVDSLKIHIELIDLQDLRTLPPIDLFGLFLVVARGRYTIPFLKPERWYGLIFTSENEVNGEINVYKESRLLRTTNRQGNITTAEDLYEVLMHRNMDGEESAERLYVTAEWKGEERLPHGELHVNVKVHCESSSTTEQMILHSDEDSVTIEISMDLLYDIEQLNDTIHKVMAHITPLKCHEICWHTSLMANTEMATFSKDAPQECHPIDGTNSTTFLRHMQRHTVEQQDSGYELVVETEIQEKSEEGYVTLSARNLAENSSSSKPRSKTFSTKKSNGTFRLSLPEDSIYAAHYQYTKVKPFHYTTMEHFLLEIAPINSSELTKPLIETHFEFDNYTIGENEIIYTPTVTLAKGGSYADHEVMLHMGPSCEDRNSSIWDFHMNQTSHRIDLTTMVCSNNPEAFFCNHTGNYPLCSPMLCYSSIVTIDSIDYPSDVRCVNVTAHFPTDSSASSHIRWNFILLLIVLYCLCFQ